MIREIKDLLIYLRHFLFPQGSSQEAIYLKYIKPIIRIFWMRQKEMSPFEKKFFLHNGAHYLSPTDLRVSSVLLRRVLIVGSCLAEGWGSRLGCPYDYVMINHINELVDVPPRESYEYDLQIIQIPLRLLLPDGVLWRLPYDDLASYQGVFDETVEKMFKYLYMASKWNRLHSIPTLVANFLLPQANSVGVFAASYDLRNPVYFVDQLNIRLAQSTKTYQNMYLLDIDSIAGSIGKQYIQDDIVELESHASVLGASYYEKDKEQIESILPMNQHYLLKIEVFFDAIGHQIELMYRIIRKVDRVRLVIVDLDNTLWRGSPIEEGEVNAKNTEGWPLGVMEALYYLRKRGILLGIACTHDEDLVHNFWPKIMRGRMLMDDFSVIRIDRRLIAEKLQDIMESVNISPEETLYISAKSLNRIAVKEAFPRVRILGDDPYYLKQILLWSSETQMVPVDMG